MSSTRDEKLRIGLDHKSRGNTAFLSNDLKSALHSYHLAVLYLSGLENRSILGLVGQNSGTQQDLSSDDEGGEKELSAVYSNMAACYLKQSNYTRAIESAEKSLQLDSRNVKAKWRKAQALRLRGDLYPAQAYLEKTIAELEGEARQSFESELKAVHKLISNKEALARNKWKGFLGRNPNVLANSEAQEAGGKAKQPSS